DQAWLTLLWEAGCTVTIQARVCDSADSWAISRHQASETIKASSDSSLSDTFLNFTELIKQLKVEQVSDAKRFGLKYNGTDYNAAMHGAAQALQGLMGPGSRFPEALRKLEMAFGRELLSNSYAKLRRLTSLSKGCDKTAAWLVESLHLALKLRLTTPPKATEAWLDRDRRHNTAGYWPCQLVVKEALLAKLPEADAEESNLITEDDEEMPQEELQQATALESLKGKFNRATGAVFEFLLDLARGRYFADCKDLAKQGDSTTVGKHVQDAVGASSKEKESLSGMMKALVVVIQNFEVTASAKSVSLSATGAAPAPSFMASLGEKGGEDDEATKAERERVWRLVQAERKKVIGLGFAKAASTKDNFAEAFRNAGKVFSFSGTLNSQHRLIVASADLLSESGSEPWATPSNPDKEIFKQMCEFVAGCTGAADFGVVLDGRLREEDTFLSLSQSEQGWIIYEGGCPARAGRARRVFMGCRKVESMCLRMPTARTRIKVQPRENFCTTGESTTFQTTWSSVKFRQSAELPLIALSAKKLVLDVDVAEPPEDWVEKHGAAIPCFWQEGKSIAFWTSFLDELKIAAIFDLSPGSGGLLEAALSRGVSYYGMCKNKQHMQWLAAIADRAACGLIATEGSSLHSTELSVSIKKFFGDVLLELQPKEDMEEDPWEPELDA
ncbi:Cdkl4, partial [Symbiodinium necroappetens]